jgi:hypothetical protein
MLDSSSTNHENKGVIPAQAGIQNNMEEVDSCWSLARCKTGQE